MNHPGHSRPPALPARIFFALLVGIILLAPALRAQTALRPVEHRLLLIFNTSADMKKRAGAVQDALTTMLATSMSGQLHAGDGIGVWTFDQKLRTGEFPLRNWQPENAELIAKNIGAFIKKQRYSAATSFEALQPLLNQVVQNSDRLTALIFCDGEAQMQGTPFDAGINQVLGQKLAERKKSRQPFIIVLRSQFGKYTGCIVSFPPAQINLPKFPPLPAPPPPPPVIPPPPAPVAIVEPLVIVGTNVGTNLPPTKPEPVQTAPAPPTNRVVAPTSPVVLPVPSTAVTNVIVRLPENSGLSSGGALAVGAGLLVMSAVVLAWMIRRTRETEQSTLITRSMDRKGEPPPGE